MVVVGKSDKPVYLSIFNESAKLEDAKALWGLDSFETQKSLLKKHPNAAVLTIRPAGENLCRVAIILNETASAAGQSGYGAVMGSKNLKAIVIKGTATLRVARPEVLMKLMQERMDAKGWREDSFLMAEKAIKMYRGAFLAKEMEHPWLISMRERLRSKFLRSVSRLGNYWCQARQWGKAIECYYRGLEVDDLAEELCQGAMVCYQNLGLEANALSIYNRFEKRIKAVLGIEPSSKTKALRDALLKKSNKP